MHGSLEHNVPVRVPAETVQLVHVYFCFVRC